MVEVSLKSLRRSGELNAPLIVSSWQHPRFTRRILSKEATGRRDNRESLILASSLRSSEARSLLPYLVPLGRAAETPAPAEHLSPSLKGRWCSAQNGLHKFNVIAYLLLPFIPCSVLECACRSFAVSIYRLKIERESARAGSLQAASPSGVPTSLRRTQTSRSIVTSSPSSCLGRRRWKMQTRKTVSHWRNLPRTTTCRRML
jgi:hypothetical protein